MSLNTKKMSKNSKLVLAVETSCDDTCCAIVRDGKEVLSSVIASQIDLHKQFGGVVPEEASRMHIEKLSLVIDKALEKADVSLDDIDAVGVTYAPGLVGALLVGLNEAKAIAFALKKPLVATHHIKSHIFANFIENDIDFPFVCLVASGGHTHLFEVNDYDDIKLKGQTLDDAIGEAYDKVARALGLGYPGGPIIDKMAKKGDKTAIDFPRSWLKKDEYNFSFSGIKSAVLNYLNQAKMKGEEIVVEDVCASFQAAVIEVLVKKTTNLAKARGIKRIAIGGGVSANSYLREEMQKACDEQGIDFYYPSMQYCTDNAAMVGVTAYYELLAGNVADYSVNAIGTLELSN